MIPLSEFSKKNQYYIGEFIYSKSVGVLIMSDCENVVSMFEQKGIDTKGVEMTADAISWLIRKNIDAKDVATIMTSYYAGALP